MKMKNKMIGVFICVLMIATILPVESLPGENNIDQTSSKITVDAKCIRSTYNEIDDGYKDNLSLKCPVMINPPAPLGSDGASPKPLIKDTPDEFSWRDYNGSDWTTPVEHQGDCGSCWDFAAIGTLESIIKIRENCPKLDVDLSEQYVMSCLPEAGGCHGGNAYWAFYYINDTSSKGNYHNGVIPESCFPYQGDDEVSCSDKCSDWESKLIPISDFGYWSPDGSSKDRDAIKTQVMETGPVATHIKATRQFRSWGLTHHDSEDYFHYPGSVKWVNHVVVIVGWKDDPSISHGGYWICKNSWGSYWGCNGFFNIEYGSLNIDNSEIVWVDYDPNSIDWPPVADAGGPHGGHIGEEITFNAGGSFDPDGHISSYSWDFGDGTSSTGVTTMHAYSQLGVYNITLTVVDSSNKTANDTIRVWIQESDSHPNKPDITGTLSGKTGRRYEYTFTTIDPDGNDIYYYIDWGDSTSSGWVGPYSSGEVAILKHRWSGYGTYTIRAKSKDVFDEESSWGVLEISMPANKQLVDILFLRFLEQFPYAFSLFRNIMLRVYSFIV